MNWVMHEFRLEDKLLAMPVAIQVVGVNQVSKCQIFIIYVNLLFFTPSHIFESISSRVADEEGFQAELFKFGASVLGPYLSILF